MQEVQKTEKRKDTRGRVLRTGESQRPDGSYQFPGERAVDIDEQAPILTDACNPVEDLIDYS